MEIKKTKDMQTMSELYAKADKIQPLAEKDGHIFVTFEDAAVLNSIAAQEPSTGLQTRNRDGSLASTGKTVHAVNPDYFFANRYRMKGAKGKERLWLVSGHTVDGYRCIKEQASGRLFLKNILCYVIAKDEAGEYYLEKTTLITDVEFITDFTERLSNSLMAKLLPIIADYNSSDVTTTEVMPF